MGIHKLSQNVWDKLTAVEKKEFSQLLKAQTGNLEMTSNPPFIVSKEASDKFKWKDKINFGPMTPGKITPAGHIQLTTKEVTKKVHLPYTVVSEEIINEQELSIKDEVVQQLAKKMAAGYEEDILKDMVDGAMSNQLPPVIDKPFHEKVMDEVVKKGAEDIAKSIDEHVIKGMKMFGQGMGGEIHLMKDGKVHTTLKVPNITFSEDQHDLNFQVGDAPHPIEINDHFVADNGKIYMVTDMAVSVGGIDSNVMQDVNAKLISPDPKPQNAGLYDKAKKMIFGVDPAKGKDESMVSVWSNQDDVLSLQNQTKTIFNKPYNESPDFMKPKDPSLLKYYVMPINYEDWDQFPQLKVKYKIGSHHKYEGTVFEVVNHDKDILHQQFKITMKEDEFIGMTGPDDHLMDGIEGPGVTVGGTTMEDLFGGDAAILDELSITPPADDIELKKRSERSKMFYELTHKVKL